MSKYTIRKLNVRDLGKMVKILSKIIGDIRQQLGEDIENVSQNVLGMVIVESALKHAEDEFIELLADLVGYDVATFEGESFDAPLVILEALMEQEDLLDFFEKAKNLAKKFTGKVST